MQAAPSCAANIIAPQLPTTASPSDIRLPTSLLLGRGEAKTRQPKREGRISAQRPRKIAQCQLATPYTWHGDGGTRCCAFFISGCARLANGYVGLMALA